RKSPPPVAAGGRARTMREQRGRYSSPSYPTRRTKWGAPERDAGGCLWWVKYNLDPHDHHMSRPFAGWAIQTENLERLAALGGLGVRIHTVDGQRLEASLAAFRRHG